MKKGPTKPTMDQMLMGMALVAAFRSNCRRAFVGAVATIDNRVKSLGYAGSPPGEPECLDVGCDLGPEGGCVRTIHAEANAIAWAAKEGSSLRGATIYTTMSPCVTCARLILQAGIKRVVYHCEYRDTSGIDFLRSHGIEVVHLTDLGVYQMLADALAERIEEWRRINVGENPVN